MKTTPFFKLFLVLTLLTAFTSCRKKIEVQQPVTQKVEFPRIMITDSLLSTQMPLYELSEDFINSFLQKADNFDGTKVVMNIQKPKEWGLVGWEQLPGNNELWLIQSKDREWTYLAITSGAATQRIKDVVPIGLDIATGGNDYNEREVWGCRRDDDGGFIVDKFYELKCDVRDSLQQDKTSHALEKYIIGSMGMFECIPQTLTDSLQCNVVIAYKWPEQEVENWEDVLMEIEPFCEENNIYFASATQGFTAVKVTDYEMNPIATLDLLPLMQSNEAGLILLNNNTSPQHLNFAKADYLKMKISKCFKINKKH